MSGLTDQIICGRICVFGNFNLSFNCDLCKNVSRTSEEFVLHIRDHFPQLSNVHEDCSSCGSDTEDFISCASCFSENNGDEDFVSCCSEIEADDLQDDASSQSKAAENLLTEECDLAIQENAQNEQNERSANKTNNTSEHNVIEVECLKRRSNRIHTKHLRQETADTQNKKNSATITTGTNISRRAKIINSQLSYISENPHAINDAPLKIKGHFECSFCCKIFTNKWNQNRHENVHTGNRPYQCHSCPKTFTQGGNLNTHVKLIHTKDLRYKCTECKKRFVNKSELHIHNREKHLANTDPRRYFPCKLCDSKFETRARLKYHDSRLHRQNSARFTCDHCQLQFTYRQYIVRHMELHTGKNFICKHCNKKFAQSTVKGNHEKKCVSLKRNKINVFE